MMSRASTLVSNCNGPVRSGLAACHIVKDRWVSKVLFAGESLCVRDDGCQDGSAGATARAAKKHQPPR